MFAQRETDPADFPEGPSRCPSVTAWFVARLHDQELPGSAPRRTNPNRKTTERGPRPPGVRRADFRPTTRFSPCSVVISRTNSKLTEVCTRICTVGIVVYVQLEPESQKRNLPTTNLDSPPLVRSHQPRLCTALPSSGRNSWSLHMNRRPVQKSCPSDKLDSHTKLVALCWTGLLLHLSIHLGFDGTAD